MGKAPEARRPGREQGTARDGREGRTITVDGASVAVVPRVYELASAGLTDREVGAATGIALKRVAEILTNPFYVSRLWSVEESAFGALINSGT